MRIQCELDVFEGTALLSGNPLQVSGVGKKGLQIGCNPEINICQVLIRGIADGNVPHNWDMILLQREVDHRQNGNLHVELFRRQIIGFRRGERQLFRCRFGLLPERLPGLIGDGRLNLCGLFSQEIALFLPLPGLIISKRRFGASLRLVIGLRVKSPVSIHLHEPDAQAVRHAQKNPGPLFCIQAGVDRVVSGLPQSGQDVINAAREQARPG